MTIISTAVRHLLAAGVTGEALIEAIADMEAAQPKDAVAEKRRAWDRERKRAAKEARSGGIPVESAESADSVTGPALSPAPNEINSNPHPHTHPDNTPPRARGADPFPCPEWCEAPVWADLKRNRKTKKLTNTATAHRQFVAAVLAMADDDWPPGRLVEAIAAKGWGGAYDPREDTSPNDRTQRPPNQRQTTRQTGERVAARYAAAGGGAAHLLPSAGPPGWDDRG